MWILGKNCQTVAQHSDVQSKSKVSYFFTIVYLQQNDNRAKNNKMGHC